MIFYCTCMQHGNMNKSYLHPHYIGHSLSLPIMSDDKLLCLYLVSRTASGNMSAEGFWGALSKGLHTLMYSQWGEVMGTVNVVTSELAD